MWKSWKTGYVHSQLLLYTAKKNSIEVIFHHIGRPINCIIIIVTSRTQHYNLNMCNEYLQRKTDIVYNIECYVYCFNCYFEPARIVGSFLDWLLIYMNCRNYNWDVILVTTAWWWWNINIKLNSNEEITECVAKNGSVYSCSLLLRNTTTFSMCLKNE